VGYLSYEGQALAEPKELHLHAEALLDGYACRAEIKFETFEWRGWNDGKPLLFVPVAAMISVRAGRHRAVLGWCDAVPDDCLQPPNGGRYSGSLSFTVPLTPERLERLESLRNGGEIEFVVRVVADPIVDGRIGRRTSCEAHLEVAEKAWAEFLRAVEFEEHVLIDVVLPPDADPDLRDAYARLRKAVRKRTEGEHGEAIGDARLAIDALERTGFGGKAPKGIVAFFKDNAKRLTMQERYAAVRAVLELFLSPPHHAEHDHESFDRRESTFAVAVAAAVLSLAKRYKSP
jgi:hypothetical protein